MNWSRCPESRKPGLIGKTRKSPPPPVLNTSRSPLHFLDGLFVSLGGFFCSGGNVEAWYNFEKGILAFLWPEWILGKMAFPLKPIEVLNQTASRGGSKEQSKAWHYWEMKLRLWGHCSCLLITHINCSCKPEHLLVPELSTSSFFRVLGEGLLTTSLDPMRPENWILSRATREHTSSEDQQLGVWTPTGL